MNTTIDTSGVAALVASMDHRIVTNGDIRIGVRVAGEGPLLVLVHGFPDSWISWRHQIGELVAAGYTVAVMETRGYGTSSMPDEVERYTLTELSSDIIAVIDDLEQDNAVLIGHDWGGAQVFATSLLAPDKVRAVVSFAYPAPPYSDVLPMQMWKTTYTDRLFYQNYFAEPGVAEAELEADPARSIRLFLYALSGDRPAGVDGLIRPPGVTRLLEDIPEPEPLPSWLSTEELDHYAAEFAAGGFRGPINRYRAQDLDVGQMRPWAENTIDQPALWIGGGADPARHLIPGVDKYIDPVPRCSDVRGVHVLDGIGHWIQQEAPRESNQLLLEFLSDVAPAVPR